MEGLLYSFSKFGLFPWNYIERIMNEENHWDHNVEGDAVEGVMEYGGRDEVVPVLREVKSGLAPGPLHE